jgi:hypothetical protein
MVRNFLSRLRSTCAANALGIGVAIAILMILFTSLNYFSNFPKVKSTDQAIWGQFGDYFGGVLNPLLSFMALVGLFFNLRSQQEEGKKAARRHDDETFETRLFQLLSLSHSSVLAVKFVDVVNPLKSVEYEGHRGVAFSLNKLQEDYLYKVPRVKAEEMYEALLPAFNKWKRDYWPGVASYLESMLFLMAYVVDNSPAGRDVDFSMRAVLSQMSSDEKLLVYYVMIFSPRQKFIFSDLLEKEFLNSSSYDDLAPYRRALMHSAVLYRLTP